MSSSQLKKFIVRPVVISAAVFSVLTLPLALFGSKPVTIQMQSEPVFYGHLRDIATPYLGLATALSLGTGVACVAITGWRQSTRKSSRAEEELLELEQSLKQKEAELEALKFSESRLYASGLDEFLERETTQKPLLEYLASNVDSEPVVESLAIAEQPIEAQAVVLSPVTVQETAVKFASAQTFLGYKKADATTKLSSHETQPTSQEIEQLHRQLQQIMAQVASVQTALLATQNGMKSEAQVSENSSELHLVETWSVHKTVS